MLKLVRSYVVNVARLFQIRFNKQDLNGGILAAAIYIACREMGISRTLKDIAATSNVKLKEVAKSYRLLCLELELKIPIVDPIKYIAKVANNANLSEKTKRQAAEIMIDVTK